MGIMWGVCASAALLLAALAGPTGVSTDNAEMTASGTTETTPVNFIPAGTLVEIHIDEQVSSKTNKTGDWFDITLAQPITLNGVELVPAGTHGRGQVVHAAKSGWAGKPGELILAARYLETPNGQVPLRAMKLGAMGKNNSDVAFAASMAFTPLPFVISGTSAVVKPGFLATAKLAVDLYPQGAAPASAVETPSSNPETDIQQATEEQ